MRKIFKESLPQDIENELDDFLSTHPTEVLSYWDWRDMLKLKIKVYQGLHDSIKPFAEEVDKILDDYKDIDLNDSKNHFVTDEINKKLDSIGVLQDSETRRKLDELSKKHYE